MQEGLRLALSVEPAAGVTAVKVLALDLSRGRIGSVRAPLK
jgi:hypothetical protein